MGDFQLLTGGADAFGEILRCCAAARRSIRINMFIWRDDGIGNALARSVLEAADRGVKVSVTKDRFGGAYERAEETGQSFWNKRPDPLASFAAGLLKTAMPAGKRAAAGAQRPSALAEALLRHPNVAADVARYRFDHTKYYVFDDETLIFGGINVEDKEVGADITGQTYRDYMIAVRRPAEVRLFCSRLAGAEEYDPARRMDYIWNGRLDGAYRNGILPGYLEFIRSAERSLRVMMPYIGDRRMERAFLDAAARGADVAFILPRQANLQQDCNMLSARRMHRESGGRIRFFLTPVMCHAKMMLADGVRLTLGSANLNRDGVSRGRQLNCVSRDPALAAAAQRDFDETLAASRPASDFPYAPAAARLESLFMG